jgi:hypothetical protein
MIHFLGARAAGAGVIPTKFVSAVVDSTPYPNTVVSPTPLRTPFVLPMSSIVHRLLWTGREEGKANVGNVR